jgi:hypothetical protein
MGASSLSAFVLLAVSVPLFWFGAYSAWEKKALALDSEKARNAKQTTGLLARTRFHANNVGRGGLLTLVVRNDHRASLRSRLASIVACADRNGVKTPVQISAQA